MIQKDECTDAKWLGKPIIPGIGDKDCCSAMFPFPIFHYGEPHDHNRDDSDDIGHLLAGRLWRSILQKHESIWDRVTLSVRQYGLSVRHTQFDKIAFGTTVDQAGMALNHHP